MMLRAWKDFTPEIKGMFIGSLIPAFAFLVNMLFSRIETVGNLPNILAILGVILKSSLLISAVLPSTKILVIDNLLSLLISAVVMGLLGYYSGYLYKKGKVKNKTFAWALALLPWFIYFIIGFFLMLMLAVLG